MELNHRTHLEASTEQLALISNIFRLTDIHNNRFAAIITWPVKTETFCKSVANIVDHNPTQRR